MLSRLNFRRGFVLTVAVSRAPGLEALIGGRIRHAATAGGFCEPLRVRVRRPHFRDRFSVPQRREHQTLAMSADCDQLAEAREGKRRQVDDMAQYQVEISDEKRPSVFSIARMCSILRMQHKSPIGTDINVRLAHH